MAEDRADSDCKLEFNGIFIKDGDYERVNDDRRDIRSSF
jgi:hypothetical protein